MAWAAAAAPVVGGVIGNLASAGDRRNARDLASQAMGEIMSLGLPPDLSAPLILEKYKQAGLLTPELEQSIQAGVSEMTKVKADQQAVDAQKQALNLISQRGKVGLTPEERLQLEQITRDTAKAAQARQQSILQNMAARGQGGSGAELAAQLAASQEAAERQNQASLQTGAAASQAALQALAQQGQLAGNIRNSSFGEGSQIATAEDARKQFDIQNMRDVQQRNVGSKNQGQEFNLRTAQDISNRNTGQQNQEAQRQAEAKRQYWQDQMDRAKLRAGAYTGQSDLAQKQAQGTANMWSGIGQGAGQGIAAFSK